MAGLVGYASSDEDSGDEHPQIQAPPPPKKSVSQPVSQPIDVRASKPITTNAKSPPQAAPGPAPGAALPPTSAAPLGPSLPPMDTSAPTASLPEPDDDSNPAAAPSSPYTTTRSLIHDLTLPSIPNFDIPPSPPGSPPPGAAATNRKFSQFLDLKKKGTHFNAKLEQSSALRNPALTDKLLQFVDVLPPLAGDGTEEKSMQYQTTLARDVWDPAAFPDWAFRDKLKRARDRTAKDREAARAAPGRSSVEFVSGSTTAAVSGAGGLSRGEKRKSGWQ